MYRFLIFAFFLYFAHCAEIATPGYADLNQPNVSLRNLPAMPAWSGTPVTYPQGYSHTNYLYYGAWNYQVQAYPYLPYRSNSRYAPNYPLNGITNKISPSRNSDSKKKPAKNFVCTGIHRYASKLSQDLTGQYTRKNFLKFFVEAVGVIKAPPSVNEDQIVAFILSKDLQTPRIIEEVKPKTDGEKITAIEVLFSKKEENKESSFWKQEAEEPKSILSIAIFTQVDAPVKFIDKGGAQAQTDRDEPLFLTSGDYQSPVSDWKLVSSISSRGVINKIFRTKESIEEVEKVVNDPVAIRRLLKMDFTKETAYLTGRIFKNREQAKDLCTRKIVKILEVGKNGLLHNVEVEENEKAANLAVNPDTDQEKKKTYFCGSYAITEIPKGFEGLNTFSVRRISDSKE